MWTDRLMLSLERLGWPNSVASGVQHAVHEAYAAAGPAGRRVKDFLHGTWLGHPLHPVLTDVPIGAWTAALMLDLLQDVTGQEEFSKGADAAVTLGVAAAGGAALAGITDWSDVTDRRRLIGLTHATLNIVATIMYTSSALLRKQGRRGTGKASSLLGFAMVSASAYLGGDMVFARKIGVNHTAEIRLPQEYVPALPAAELGEGEMHKVELKGGAPIFLVKRDGQVYALVERCAHQGGRLSQGTLHDHNVTCPLHGSTFSLEDGHVVHGPSAYPQPALDVRIRGGQIEVRDRRAGYKAGG